LRAAIGLLVTAIEDERRSRRLDHIVLICVLVVNLATHNEVDVGVAVAVEQRAGIAGLACAGPNAGGVPAPEDVVVILVAIVPAHLGQIDLGGVDVVCPLLVDDNEVRVEEGVGERRHRHQS